MDSLVEAQHVRDLHGPAERLRACALDKPLSVPAIRWPIEVPSMDYRVEPGWHSHPKRRRLKRRLGAEAVLALMDLWEFCANEAHCRTDGDLSGLSDEEVADAAGWDGDASEFVEALLECRLLEGGLGKRVIHDWAGHQPFVAGFSRRSEQASDAAKRRWHATRMRTACGPHADRNAPSPTPSPTPIPDPSPDPAARARAIPVPPATGPGPEHDPRLAAALVRLFPELEPDIAGHLSMWSDAYPGVDLLQLAKEARSKAAARGHKIENPAALLGRWYQRAYHEQRQAGDAAFLEAHAKRKREEAAERRLVAQLDGPKDAKPIGADITRLMAALEKRNASE